MAALVDLLPGYAALWDRVTAHVAGELRQRHPDAAIEIQRLADSTRAEPSAVEAMVSQGVDVARRHGARLDRKSRRVLEHGVAAHVSVAKLRRTYQRIAAIDSTLNTIDADEADALLDLWRTYLHRHLETTTKYATEAHNLLVADQPKRQSFKTEIEAWSQARKEALARGRQEVAHGNTIFVRAIDEDGLWVPMLISGLGSFDALDEMVRPRNDALSRRISLWSAGPKEVTAHAIAEGDAYCSHVASV
jgi:hypothetical protein